jgi:small nuclear ribonucleoprotein (snRNP)-like protein
MVGLMVMSAPISSAEEVKYELKPAATMKTLLTDSLGKRVVLRLESGEEMEGTVTVVGEHLVHISKLSRRDFFDAIVSIDRISAVIIRVR